jgi:pyridoxamine 5'-phosphate oxidase
MQIDISALRRDYARDELSEKSVDSDPIVQFRRWFDQALEAQVIDANAMTVATAAPDGRPSARVLLLKELDGRGFVFYTNLASAKSRDLAANPFAALCFYWAELERQVRIEGRVEPISDEEADAYFASRPHGSRVGAHASPQSSVIPSAEFLAERVAALEARFEGSEIPRPANWGGYRLIPDRIELWQGRPSRLHDRLVYQRSGSDWVLQRLAP